MSRHLITALMAAALIAGCTSGDEETVVPTNSERQAGADATTASGPATTGIPVATTVVPPPGPLIGIAVPEARIETIEEIESEVEHRLHLVRVFLRWDDKVAETDIGAIQGGGRAVHLSVRPVRSDGSPIPWAAIAAAQPGSTLHDEMTAWADAIVLLGPQSAIHVQP